LATIHIQDRWHSFKKNTTQIALLVFANAQIFLYSQTIKKVSKAKTQKPKEQFLANAQPKIVAKNVNLGLS
jgi:hypothetical protein